MELNFDTPYETLKYLTSSEIDYVKLNDFAKKLESQISDLHTNSEGRQFLSITQCILECYKRINSFNSTQWISENKLQNGLLSNQYPIEFSRLNGKGEICNYRIINFDQIDFNTEIINKQEIINKTKQSKITNNCKQNNENLEYKKVLTLLENGENVFLTGFAGTGKSYILNKLKEKLKKKLTITSTTGIASVYVKGQTLHSWAGVGLCKNPLDKTIDKIRTKVSTLKQILNCKILAIDEISMLNVETFEYVDNVLKAIRESNEPFGGIQVLLIGDFFQLPPVEIRKLMSDETFSGNNYHYCFQSLLWKKFNLKNVILKKNYRQNEEKFINALSHLRKNELTDDDVKLFLSRECNSETHESDILHIFSTNEEANRYNKIKFNLIDEPIRIFKSIDCVYRGKNQIYTNFTQNENYILEIFGKNCRAENEIELKLGARVMLLINQDFNKGLINGACGTIVDFNEDSISVKFDNGTQSSIQRHIFEYYYHDKLVAERLQYPLKLAYGITIHKSQGMTLDKLVVDCSRIFEKGQAYVAISRVKTLNGLILKAFSPDKIMVDNTVVKFYNNLEEVDDVEPLYKTIIDTDEEVNIINDEESKNIIIECVTEFSGSYGKSGIVKILTGSRSIKDNGYNTQVINSKFLGILKSRTQKDLIKIIDSLIEEGVFITKLVSFGRPILCIKK